MIELKKTVKLDGCNSPKEAAKVEKEGKKYGIVDIYW